MARESLYFLSLHCVLTSSIDSFGKHFLGCSRGPMRIHRHDVLVDIIYKALSQDASSAFLIVMVYARVTSSILISSMVALPILISLCSTTQPAYISSSTSCAGVAAAAGELAKDEKHLAAGEKAGADFIPKLLKHGHHLLCDPSTPRSAWCSTQIS